MITCAACGQSDEELDLLECRICNRMCCCTIYPQKGSKIYNSFIEKYERINCYMQVCEKCKIRDSPEPLSLMCHKLIVVNDDAKRYECYSCKSLYINPKDIINNKCLLCKKD